MPTLADLLAYTRPEGGAVRFVFTQPAGYPEVHVLRMPTGVAPTSPTDPQGRLVFSGLPKRAEADWRVRLFAENPTLERRGAVWDLQAYEGYGSEERAVVDGSADYWFWPKNGATFGDPVKQAVTVSRSLNSFLVLNVKQVLYNRLRYHAAATTPTTTVLEQEHIAEGQAYPQVLLKVRHAIQTRDLSEGSTESGSIRSVTWRATADLLILATDPGQRNTLSAHFRTRLQGDLWLLEELGWQGLELSDQDRLNDLGDAQVYANEMTLSGLVDGHLTIGPSYTVQDLAAYYRTYL